MYSIPFLVYILKKYLKNNSGNQYLIFSKRKSQRLYCIRLKIHKILVLKFIILLKFMSGLSVAMKRKSIEKVEPILPKTLKIREPSANGRTVHQNFKPAEVLKEFRKKQLYTYGNLSTQKSLSNLNTDDLVVMKQSRFDDDHHNTESIEQLLDTKMISNLPSSRTKKDQTNKKSISNTQENLTPKKQSFQSQDFEKEDHQMLSKQKQELKQQKVQEPQQSEKEGQNYDDYVLGDKIEIQQEQDQMKKKSFQKYATNLNSGDIQDAESIARADYIHFQNQRKRLTQLKEDQEIISLMQQYKNNKQILINQSTRKHQTHRIMASIGKAPKIQKSFSLPFLKPKREVEVPEVQQRQYDKTKRNLLGRDVKKSGKFCSSQLIASLSSGKLGFGRKKIRTICEQDIYEDEMNSLQNIKSKLRSKGIIIDTNKLTKGLVNIKNELQYQKVVVFPEKNIPSNPIYKKFPL